MQMKVQPRCLSRHPVVGVTGGAGLLRTDTPLYQEKTSLARGAVLARGRGGLKKTLWGSVWAPS